MDIPARSTPQNLWPLLIYEVPITTIETLERKISSHLRRWLGLPKSLSSIALYGRSNKLQLPLKSLEEEYKVSKTRVVLQYKDSEDSMVSNAGIEVKTGRKWRAEEAVQQAESRLHFSKLVGAVTRGRAGLGSIPAPKIPSKRKEKRCQVQSEVRAVLEERRTCKAVGMSKQGAWARWENAIQRRVTWNELWKAEPHRIKFLIQAVYDVLPSPSNLHNWGKIESPACVLCSKIGSLEHILSCCPKALGEGRYRWRHDQVLKAIAEAIAGGVEKARHSQIARKNIHFVKAGEVRKTTTPQSRAGILNTAKDWKLLVDLEKQLKFPSHITKTSLRPDIVLFSDSTKQVVMLELTVPWEDRLEEAFERKLTKYEQLTESCQGAGWKARCLPIEVGCRGFVAQSLSRAFSTLGIEGRGKRIALRAVYTTTSFHESVTFPCQIGFSFTPQRAPCSLNRRSTGYDSRGSFTENFQWRPSSLKHGFNEDGQVTDVQ
ncbi:hypothetical protein WMY93_010360 [Mugilogobius chulae]|uniref:Reverse transcriptase n=1 Tax=Mugilogobius chulae TaxID=88201 RepID=A0AAW0PIL2_9GOBI